jgi:hypothetical protein
MGHSNQPSKQNIPQKIGQHRGEELYNHPTLEPHKIVLQFMLVGGKRVSICHAHGQR